MTDIAINNTLVTISNTPGTSGVFVLALPVSGYRDFTAAHDIATGKTFTITVKDTGGDQQFSGCTYTHDTRTINIGASEDSSTGGNVSFTSTAVIGVVASAAFGSALAVAMQSVIPGGRLTLESGVPVSTASQTAKTTIYYTPFVHNTVPLWDGANWVPTLFTETALPLGTLTAAKCYDVFGYLSAGALALELLAWADDTTRATEVTLQDGRYCKSGDKTRLLLGTFYTTSATTTEDSEVKRLLWNAYNRTTKQLYLQYTATASWTYNTQTWRPLANNLSTPCRVSFVCGVIGDLLTIDAKTHTAILSSSSLSSYASTGISINATNTNDATVPARYGQPNNASPQGFQAPLSSRLIYTPSIGYTFLQQTEISEGLGVTMYSADTGSRRYETGMLGALLC